MTYPAVSIVMSVYNGERYLNAAVESILKQSFADFEFIIIDDGSTDDTARILRGYQDPRIVLVSDPENRGLVCSLNRGLELARAKYVARQDADDISLPRRLAKQVSFLDRHPLCSLVGTDFFKIDENGNVLDRIHMPSDDLFIKWHMLFQNPFGHGTVMFRTDKVRELGGYSTSPDALHVEDYDLWSRMVFAGVSLANLPELLVMWRLNPQGVTGTYPEVRSANYRARMRQNVRTLDPEGLTNTRRCDLVSLIEAQTDAEATLDETRTALLDLRKLLEKFCEYFALDPSQRRKVHQEAINRAALTLLHIAQCRSYDLRLDEARSFAKLAIGLRRRILFEPSYLRVLTKVVLGARLTLRIRRFRSHVRSNLKDASTSQRRNLSVS